MDVNLCRCCLSPNSEVSLFDSEVKEKFLEITSLEVHLDDGLPQNLCADCYAIMNSAYQFRKQCIKMDTELKLHIEALLNQAVDIQNESEVQENLPKVIEEESQDQCENLKSMVKTETNDSDDDCYYVLVIDDPKEKDSEKEIDKTITPSIKLEQLDPKESTEMQESSEESQKEQGSFEKTFKSFLVSEKVPVNVPATILENEEESQENDDFNNAMEVDESQESNNPEQILPDINYSQEKTVNDIVETFTGSIENLTNSKNSLIKILTTTGTDGTILLKSNDKVTYLTHNDDGDPLSQDEEVIFCEGDDTSQFQILKCEGSELVIEYADDSQISTVLQQEDGTFLCDCGEQFENLADYENHQYTHNPAGDHLCNMCGKGFDSAEILTGHMLLHSVSGLLIMCPFCNQLIKRNVLTQHIKHSHNNIKPQCSVCSKTFANPNNLKRHMMIHSGLKEFECDICFKRFHQKITMQTHRLTHVNPFACNECDDVFDNKEALQNHKESNECSKSKIAKVKEQVLKTVKQEITTNLGKLLGYACALCEKMFSVESALEQHIELTHIVDPTELLCSECGEVLPSKKEMYSHILTHKNMKAKNMKRFECSTCGKGCASQAMLIMHERVHTNERPYPCQLCSLRFKTKTHLRTHQLTHTREKKFGCSVCMKFFALKGNLVVHLRTHTGERPYVCSICDEAFIDSKYLKKHKFKKHSIDNVPWNKY